MLKKIVKFPNVNGKFKLITYGMEEIGDVPRLAFVIRLTPSALTMAVIAAALSFIFSGSLNGVREGTIIAALLVGFIARLLGQKLKFTMTEEGEAA